MARDWRRAVFAVLAAAMLGGACALGPHAFAAAEEEPEEEQTKNAAPETAPEAPPKTGAKKRQDPADAQRTIEAALKQLQAGKSEQAVHSLSAALTGGNLPPAILAKALYVRGMAYRQQGKPAQAVSDLTSALWLKGGLGSDDRADAIKQRADAYADAGLTDRGEPDRPEAPAKTASSNWLGNLFGGSGASSDPPAPPPPAVAKAPVQKAEAQKADAAPPSKAPAAGLSGWSSKTQVQADRPALAAAPAVQAPEAPTAQPPKAPAAQPPKAPAAQAKAPAPPPARVEAPATSLKGKHLVQLGAVRTEAEAQAMAAKAKREHAALLASRQSSVDRTVFGNMGAFYRVRFGPFTSAQESRAACAKLRGSGLDCMPVGP
jgi:cell division septation protein DedD